MFIPCVLAITKDSLLSFALTNLINASGTGLIVVESNARTFEELVTEINTHKADVILLEKSSPFAGEEALTKFADFVPKGIGDHRR